MLPGAVAAEVAAKAKDTVNKATAGLADSAKKGAQLLNALADKHTAAHGAAANATAALPKPTAHWSPGGPRVRQS